MQIIDTHLHVYPEPVLEKENNISREPVNQLLSRLSDKLKKEKIEQGVAYLLDAKVLDKPFKIPNNLIISTTLDLNSWEEDLPKALEKGIKIIKILPYDQKIVRKDYTRVLQLAKKMQKKGMVLTICSTYGSRLIYETGGVELAAFIKRKVDIPIILAHGGGPKVFDALSLGLEYPNIFLDLSFSISYWWGSSVIQDYAFSLKKLGVKRCFYGSDYPYVSFKDSLGYFVKFIGKHKFSQEEAQRILYHNFVDFKRIYL